MTAEMEVKVKEMSNSRATKNVCTCGSEIAGRPPREEVDPDRD